MIPNNFFYMRLSYMCSILLYSWHVTVMIPNFSTPDCNTCAVSYSFNNYFSCYVHRMTYIYSTVLYGMMGFRTTVQGDSDTFLKKIWQNFDSSEKFFKGANNDRVVTKISSCWVNTTSRQGIKRLGISFGSIFLLFSNKSSRGPHLLVAGENPRPPALNDNPEWTNPSDSIFQRTLTKIWGFRFLSSLGWGIKNGTSLYAPLSSTFWWPLYIGTSIKQKVKGLAKCVRYDKVSLYQASFSYSWFATTWQGSRIVGQYNINFFLKNLHENRV